MWRQFWKASCPWAPRDHPPRPSRRDRAGQPPSESGRWQSTPRWRAPGSPALAASATGGRVGRLRRQAGHEHQAPGCYPTDKYLDGPSEVLLRVGVRAMRNTAMTNTRTYMARTWSAADPHIHLSGLQPDAPRGASVSALRPRPAERAPPPGATAGPDYVAAISLYPQAPQQREERATHHQVRCRRHRLFRMTLLPPAAPCRRQA